MSEEIWVHEGVAENDELPLEEKKKVLKDFTIYRNTVCNQGHICCYNCTANGDPRHCAQTMFTNCSVCGHPSSGHYSG